jgi:hypothetical protein
MSSMMKAAVLERPFLMEVKDVAHKYSLDDVK